ncbi:MAB_1171c family putative transporter [Streptomyces sp. NPDC087851]|uniref:MAB_1171c family putative transporter n=1 Tax=Streptomyces sp. NPDC087851 TaxID=3365810 RepID=UPI003809BB0B
MNTPTLVAGALWLVTLWRLPSVRHSHKQRSLALTFAALAAAMTLEVPAVRDAVNANAGVTGLPPLLKHLLGVGSAALLLDFVIAVVRPHGLAPRLRLAAIGITLPLMVVLYMLANWMPGGRVMIGAGKQAVPVLYSAVFTLYIGIAMIVATWLFLSGVRHSRTLPGKAGLGFLGLGTLLGSLYALQRVAFVTVRLTTGSGYPELENQISTVLKQLAILSIALGACLPPLSVAVEHIRAWTALKRLQPLWHRLTGAVPSVVLSTSIPKRRVRFRLDRCVIEIEDACLALREYVSAEVHQRARTLAIQKGVQEQEVEVVAEASWLRLAAASARTGSQLEGVEYPSLGVTGRSRVGELAWLRAVARSYTTSPVVAEFIRQEESLASLPAGGPERGSSHDN